MTVHVVEVRAEAAVWRQTGGFPVRDKEGCWQI